MLRRFIVPFTMVLLLPAALLGQNGKDKPKPTDDGGLAARVAALEDSVVRLQSLVDDLAGVGATGLTVVDANEQVVGTLLADGRVLWQHAGFWLTNLFNEDGFVGKLPNSFVYYTQPDCPPDDAHFFLEDPKAFTRTAWFDGDRILHAGPITVASMRSYRSVWWAPCTTLPTPTSERLLWKVTTVPLSELGWTPPFHLR